MAVKICTNCGESNIEGSTICVICGNSLKDARMEGTSNVVKDYSGNSTTTICQHCNERLAQSSVTCKYCGTVVSKKVKGSRYYNNHIPSDEGDSGGSTPMETFGRGCLWLILGTLGLLLIAFITRSTINIPLFIFIPIVIFVFWMASKKSK
ncbi:zinc ribbon domain-containing protein [Paenibacillus sp. J23TS9]|uniref:double zinc ribbon domain-containing protein n=1 Tax=Paenibacillus sp. J23TS9 TaxID=2807193 RepID=UPI001BD1B995